MIHSRQKRTSKIADKLIRLIRYPQRTVTHLHHFHGHGIHSPFVYSIIRRVVMPVRVNQPYCLQLSNALEECRVSSRTRIAVQNLYDYCRFEAFDIVAPSTDFGVSDRRLTIVRDMAGSEHVTLDDELHSACVCILSPSQNRCRHRRCRQLVKMHNGTSIEAGRFLLLFFLDGLPKQHFKI